MGVSRNNPYGNFNFEVFWHQQPDGSSIKAGFSQVSGLDMEIDVIEYRNGNDRENRVRKLPGLRKNTNVTLKRGMIGATDLYDWVAASAAGTVVPQEVTIVLLDENRNAVITWKLSNAWPSKWTGPSLNGKGNEVAIEEIVLTHEGVTME